MQNDDLSLTQEDALNLLGDLRQSHLGIIGFDFWTYYPDIQKLVPDMHGEDISGILMGPDGLRKSLDYTEDYIRNFWPNNAQRVSFIISDGKEN